MEKIIKNPKPDSSGIILNKKLCKICGDVAPGNYYGVLACDGCKSFFRRAVRGTQVYKCRFDRNCIISKDGRTQCRHCRLSKCLKAGMKKEAIQNDRDPLRYRGPNEDSPNTLTMTSLIHADQLMKGPTNMELCTKIRNGEVSMTGREVATMKEYLMSMKEQLLNMVTYAKSIQAYCELCQEDKIALLRARPGEYTVLGLARRNITLPFTDILVQGNGYILTRDEGCVMGVTRRIIDELVIPFRRLNMDDTEFALLKGILFFDPSARGLRDPERIDVFRRQAQLLLEEYSKDRQLESAGRFGDMLLILLNLQSIAQSMNEEFQYRQLFGITYIDKLVREILLGEDVKSEDASDNGGILDEGLSPPPLWVSNGSPSGSEDWRIERRRKIESMSSSGGEDSHESFSVGTGTPMSNDSDAN